MSTIPPSESSSLGPQDTNSGREVTVDPWSSRGAGLHRANPKTGVEFAMHRNVFRQAAAKLAEQTGKSWTATQVQAAGWVGDR